MTGPIGEYLVVLIAGWSSGISVYLTAAILGISGRAGWIALPGSMDTLSNWLIILTASALFIVEFVADKVPFVDSAWDSVHTFIRPVGAGAIGYMAGTDLGPIAPTLMALLTGTIALDMHAVKASTRLAINTSPEPFSNIGASLAEHSSVFFIYWFFIKHPILAALLVLSVLVLGFLLMRALWRFVKKLFHRPQSPAALRAADR